MSEPSATAERREQIVGELAEWLHAAAREAQRRLLEAESAEEFAKLTGSLSKLARGVRQSVVLQARFETERLKGEAEAALKAEIEADRPRSWKTSRILSALERVVWDEHEPDEDYEDGPGERLVADLDARLADLSVEPEFLDTPDEALIAQLCEEFALDVPAHIIQALAIVAAADPPRPNGHDGAKPDSS